MSLAEYFIGLKVLAHQLDEQYIQAQLADPAGWRLFHPYAREWR
jgi:hypothetical protein